MVALVRSRESVTLQQRNSKIWSGVVEVQGVVESQFTLESFGPQWYHQILGNQTRFVFDFKCSNLVVKLYRSIESLGHDLKS